MLRKVINFASERFRRAMGPEEARQYAGQCLLAWKSHADRGTPYDLAAYFYGVSVGDVVALDMLQASHQDELQSAAPLIASGRLTFGHLLKKLGTGAEIAAMNRVRPYRPKPRVTYL